MKITKKISFWTTVGAIVLLAMYSQSQIGTKKEVKEFLGNLKVEVSAFVNTKYPEDLIIKVDKGQVEINQPLPYCLLLDEKENLGIIFDKAENPNIKSFETKPTDFPCQPAVLVGKNYIVASGSSEIKYYKIPTEIKVEITRTWLLDNVGKYMPVVEKFGWNGYLLLPLILAVTMLPFVLLFNYWYSAIFYVVIKLFKLQGHEEVKNRYWIALFFGALLSAINMLTEATFKWKISFPFSATILIVAAGIAYLKWREKDQSDNGQNQTLQSEQKPL